MTTNLPPIDLRSVNTSARVKCFSRNLFRPVGPLPINNDREARGEPRIDCDVGGQRLRSVVLAFVALVLIASGCSAGSLLGQDADDEDDSGIPFEVQALGALAVPDGPSLTEEFDAGAGSVQISEGVSLRVPEGAFDALTEVTIQRYALVFDQYLENGPTGSVFVVSTEEEVSLGTSVFLEVEGSASSLRVLQFSNGEQIPSVVEDNGATTSIAIEHFSSVSTFVADLLEDRVAALSGENPKASDATYLSMCFEILYGLFGGDDESEYGDGGGYYNDSDYAATMAVSACTRSLIDRASRGGERVSTDCVGRRIDEDTDFRAAVEECQSEVEEAAAARSEAAVESELESSGDGLDDNAEADEAQASTEGSFCERHEKFIREIGPLQVEYARIYEDDGWESLLGHPVNSAVFESFSRGMSAMADVSPPELETAFQTVIEAFVGVSEMGVWWDERYDTDASVAAATDLIDAHILSACG